MSKSSCSCPVSNSAPTNKYTKRPSSDSW
jgi:hypothetical protein